MSNINSVPTVMPMWQRVTNNQRFLGFAWNAFKVLGVPALPFIQKWFPGATVDSINGEIVLAAPFVVGVFADWWRTHPDNFAARFIKVLNGGKMSPAAVAAVSAAIDNAPPSKP